MNKVLESLAEASSPLMVFVPRKEVASDQKFKLNVFEAASGYKLVTNLQSPKSLIENDTLKAVNASTVVSFKELSSDDSVAEMKTSEGDTVYMDIALAFDLADEKIISPITGKAITLTYASDEEETPSEDTTEEDTLDTEGESEDSETESEDDSEDTSEDDEDVSDESETDITDDMNSEDPPEDSEEDTESEEEEPSEDTETPPSDEDVSEYQDDDFDDSNDTEAKCKTTAEDESDKSEEDTTEAPEEDPSLTEENPEGETAAGGPPWYLVNKACVIKSPFGKINLKMGDMWAPVNAKTIILEKLGDDKEISVEKAVIEDLKNKSIRILATKHLLNLTAKSSKRGGRPTKEAASVETASIEVAAIDLIDTEKNIRLAALTQDGTEFAAYCGDNHIGTLRKSNASETASGLFSVPAKLFSAFKPALQNAVKTGELASLDSFGFTPVKYSVKVSDIISKAVEQTKSKLEAETAAKINTSLDRSKRIAVLSSLGLLKGAFDKKLPLVTELSNVLASAGVVDSTTVVRDILSRNAESFTKAVFEQANELAGNSDEYLTGLGDTIKKVQFKVETPVNSTGNLTTVYTKSTGDETASFSGVVSAPNKPTNRFSKVIRGLGSRR